ncbi:unnamed protein product [Ectocarpus sp. 8 AP-2014]
MFQPSLCSSIFRPSEVRKFHLSAQQPAMGMPPTTEPRQTREIEHHQATATNLHTHPTLTSSDDMQTAFFHAHKTYYYFYEIGRIRLSRIYKRPVCERKSYQHRGGRNQDGAPSVSTITQQNNALATIITTTRVMGKGSTCLSKPPPGRLPVHLDKCLFSNNKYMHTLPSNDRENGDRPQFFQVNS